MLPLTLSELAARIGASLRGPAGGQPAGCLALPSGATSNDVTLSIGRRGLPRYSGGAIAVLVATPAPEFVNALQVDDVLLACARCAAWLPVRRSASSAGGGHRHIAPTARVAATAQVGEGSRIGDHAIIEAGAIVDAGVSVGAYARVGVNVLLRNQTQIGNRVSIGAGSVIGEDGFSFIRDGDNWLRMPSFGSVRIEDDVVILPQVVIHAGVFGDTVIGRGCILDSQVLIGHDSAVGAHSAIAGQTAIAGAANIGRGCTIGGKVGIGEGVVIADRVTITAMTMVTRSILTAGSRYSSGWPAEPSIAWWRRVASLRRQQPRVTDDDTRQNDF